MLTATLALLIVCLALFAVAYRQGEGRHWAGVGQGLLLAYRMLPLMLLAFLLAGLLPVVLPTGFVREWLGAGSGLRGILLASALGALVPVGPYVVFPMVAGVYQAGASLATMVSFVVGWSLWGIGRLPYELTLLGPRFALIRTAVVLIFPPLSGILVWLLWG